MDTMTLIGIVLLAGFVAGELAQVVRLPRVTGYVLAGLALNPRLLPFIPAGFPEQTRIVTDVALAFITFSVGGTLQAKRLRRLGRSILLITLFEAECAALAVCAGVWTLGHAAPGLVGGVAALPLSLLLAALASPTDPSATLAVTHEYHARGPVTSTIMGVAAFDDVMGIVNFSIGVGIARVLLARGGGSPGPALLQPLVSVGGGILLGLCFGLLFNLMSRVVRRGTEAMYIVLVFALLCVCYGVARLAGVDELLSTMTIGAVVVNGNRHADLIFRMLERYTEELIFVLFFTLSGMYLDFSMLGHSLLLVPVFVVLRVFGKYGGTAVGSTLGRAEPSVKRYAALGLLPQGGIVIGLALLIRSQPPFAGMADRLVSVILGATVLHELIGPFASRMALSLAGELRGAHQPQAAAGGED